MGEGRGHERSEQANLCDGKNDDGEQDGEAKQQEGKLAELDLQRGADEAEHVLGRAAGLVQEAAHEPALALLLAPEKLGDAADFGLHARGHDDAQAAALGDGARGPDDVVSVADGTVVGVVLLRQLLGLLEGQVVGGEGVGVFVDGQALAREQGLVGLEVHGVEEAQVGGHHVTDVDLDHVATDEVFGLDLGHPAGVADDGGLGGRQRVQRLHRLFGAVVLHEADDDVEANHGRDHGALDVV